jgi:hypothetical protein
MNPNPTTAADTEWRTSSVLTYGKDSSHGRAANAATPNIATPKARCRMAPGHPHALARIWTSQTTDNPKRMNPRRATHAPSMPCAADSLVPCSTHE